MIAGLPVGAWILLVLAVGIGPVLQVASWWAHRGRRRGRPSARPGDDA